MITGVGKASKLMLPRGEEATAILPPEPPRHHRRYRCCSCSSSALASPRLAVVTGCIVTISRDLDRDETFVLCSTRDLRCGRTDTLADAELVQRLGAQTMSAQSTHVISAGDVAGTESDATMLGGSPQNLRRCVRHVEVNVTAARLGRWWYDVDRLAHGSERQ